MTRVCFVVGHEDTPEAFYRVALPARHLRAPMVLAGEPGAQERALAADVVWLHQPTGPEAADLAEKAIAKGRVVIVDLSEDPWNRYEVDGGYNEHRLGPLERAVAAATVLVVTSQALADALGAVDARVIEPVVPVSNPATPDEPPVLAWWSDGRQRSGWEAVAPGLLRVQRETTARIRHIGFAHMQPVTAAADPTTKLRQFTERQEWLMPSTDGAAAIASRYTEGLATATLSLDCYPAGQYRDTVSDLGILRAAAVGVPTVTTRDGPPPGCVSAPPGEWGATIIQLLNEPDTRRALSLAAREWAATRQSFAQYERLLQEV